MCVCVHAVIYLCLSICHLLCICMYMLYVKLIYIYRGKYMYLYIYIYTCICIRVTYICITWAPCDCHLLTTLDAYLRCASATGKLVLSENRSSISPFRCATESCFVEAARITGLKSEARGWHLGTSASHVLKARMNVNPGFNSWLIE